MHRLFSARASLPCCLLCAAALVSCGSEEARNAASGGSAAMGGAAGAGLGGGDNGGSTAGGGSGTSTGGSDTAGNGAAGAGTGGSAGMAVGGSGLAGMPTGGLVGEGGNAGVAGSMTGGAGGAGEGAGGAAGSMAGGAGGAGEGAGGAAGRGGVSGEGGTAAQGGSGGGGTAGEADCAGQAVSLSANGTGMDSDSAFAHVEIDPGGDLPIGNSNRTVEFWALIKTTDWVGEKNEVYYYGGGSNAGAFGLDFGTNPVTGQASNHATLNPFTGGGFNDDSTNDLGIMSGSDQWVHVAMTWNGTNVVTYVDGQPKITTAGSGVSMLATEPSSFFLGCNPSNNQCFNGLFDELRIWNVARTAQEIAGLYDQPAAGNETGLVGYYRFNEMSGTTTADAVTAAGHTAHPGTLTADTAAHNPTFVTPTTPLPLTCP